MGEILHGRARTTAADRRALKNRQERLKALAKRGGGNLKTGAKRKKRISRPGRAQALYRLQRFHRRDQRVKLAFSGYER